MVDVALDQGAGESTHVSGGVVEDVGHDVGDHRDLAPHHVDVVRVAVVVGPDICHRRGRGEPHGAPREVTTELAQHVAVVVEQPQAAGGADGGAGCGHTERNGVDRLETRGKTGGHTATERVTGAGGVDGVDLQGGHVDEVAAGQHVGTVGAGLHHRATYTGSLERTQAAARCVVTGERLELLEARLEEVDGTGQRQDARRRLVRPALVGVERDQRGGLHPAYLGDDVLGVGEWHRRDVHDPGAGHGRRDVRRQRSHLGRPPGRRAVDPVPTAVGLVDHPVAHRRSEHVDDVRRVRARRREPLESLGREVLATAGDQRDRGAARGRGGRGVHAVAAERRHQGGAVGQDDVVDGEVPDDDHLGVVAAAGNRGVS